MLVWRVPREDGNLLVVAAKDWEDGSNASRIVSMYVGTPDRAASQKRPLSGVSDSGSLPRTGIHADGLRFHDDSPNRGSQLAGEKSVPSSRPIVNFAVERPDAPHAGENAASPENAAPPSLRNEDADILRASLDPTSRRALVRGMEKALADIHADRPVDVGELIDGTRTITHIQYQSFIAEIERSDAFTDVNFGRLRPDLKDFLNAIRTEEGVSLLEGDSLIIPANVVRKFHEKRMLEGHMSADDVGQLLLDVFHRDADIASDTRYPHIQAVVALRKNLSEIGFIGRNDKTGETVIKSVYYEKTPKVHKRLGGDGSRSVKERALDSGGRGIPHPVDGAEAPPFAASRLSAVQNQEPVKTTITAPNIYVNYAVEAADEFTPAPPLSRETRAPADELRVDPDTGLLPEEVKAAELEAAGHVAPEDRDALLAAREESRRVPEYDNIGQGVIPCILEVKNGK
mgnify:CR=1 FL=1